ncbi:hypothetical protein Srufu_069900 [Streptomyces libani subsp. rufus]|nr:hypothetical protein Srufu_069900 [Streptomyces libani subsp. rufus]
MRLSTESVMSNDENSRDAALRSFQDFHAFLGDHVRRKRRVGGDDLTTALIDVRDDGDRLSEEELVAMLGMLLAAGHETTVNLLGSSVLALLNHPEQLARLRREPDGWPDAIEEVLRWEGPIQNAIWRFTREPVAVGNVTIPAGEAVALSVASAGRDPARFTDGDPFDSTRGDRGHLAFGHGIHHCVGLPDGVADVRPGRLGQPAEIGPEVAGEGQALAQAADQYYPPGCRAGGPFAEGGEGAFGGLLSVAR